MNGEERLLEIKILKQQYDRNKKVLGFCNIMLAILTPMLVTSSINLITEFITIFN